MKRTIWLALAVLLAGCEKNPLDRVRNGSGGGPTGTIVPGTSFIVFDDELVTGGNLFLYPANNVLNQTISLNDQSDPIGTYSVRYGWDGQGTISGGKNFAGFDFPVSQGDADYASTPARDLSGAAYGRVTFYARGTLSSRTSLKVEVSDDGSGGIVPPCLTLSRDGVEDFDGTPCAFNMQLTNQWRPYSITIPGPGTLSNIKDFFKATFVYDDPFPGAGAGSGGTIYFDQIQYVP